MSLVATVVDPLTEPVPAGWDAFATAQGILPAWDSRLLRATDWCTRVPASMVLVQEASSAAPVAMFHARHIGPSSIRRFVVPGRIPAVTMTECRTVPLLNSGVAFAAAADDRDRAEAVRVFEQALRRRVGAGGQLIAYRCLSDRDLRGFSGTGWLRLRQSPTMALYHEWSDVSGYLAALPRGRRKLLRKIRRAMDDGGGTAVAVAPTIDAAEACWLAESVRRRYKSRRFPPPPLPAGYFERFSQLPGVWFLTYRDPAGRLLAYVAGHDNGTDLFTGVWGSRSVTDGGRRNLYFDLFLRLLELIIRTERRRVLLGPGLAGIKSQYGARPEPLWTLVGRW